MEQHQTARACLLGLMLTVLLTVATCGPPLEAKAPLSVEATAAVDERLIGAWFMDLYSELPRRKLITLLIDRGDEADKPLDQPSTWLHVNFIVMVPEMAYSIHLRAHPTDLDGVTYYNLRRTADLPSLDYTAAGEAPGFIIMRVFVVTDDLLYVCTLGWHDDGPLSSVVEKLQSFGAEARIVRGVPRFGNQIYGDKNENQTPIGDSPDDYLILDVTSEKLADLIGSYPSNKLFFEWAWFARFGSEPDNNLLDRLRSDPESEIRQACGSH